MLLPLFVPLALLSPWPAGSPAGYPRLIPTAIVAAMTATGIRTA
jgi:hypothetical protein